MFGHYNTVDIGRILARIKIAEGKREDEWKNTIHHIALCTVFMKRFLKCWMIAVGVGSGGFGMAINSTDLNRNSFIILVHLNDTISSTLPLVTYFFGDASPENALGESFLIAWKLASDLARNKYITSITHSCGHFLRFPFVGALKLKSLFFGTR